MVKKKRQPDAHDYDSSTDSESCANMTNNCVSGGCQHVKKSVDTGKLRKQLKANGLAVECSQCAKCVSKTPATSPATEAESVETLANEVAFEYDSTLWLCLKCGTQLCGRSRNQHALQHFKTPHSDSHALTLNTRSFEIWCYDCDREVSTNMGKSLLECVDFVKKLALKPPPAPQPSSSSSNINSLQSTIISSFETLGPLVPPVVEDDNNAMIITSNKAIPLPPPIPQPAIPGMAKRVSQIESEKSKSNGIKNNSNSSKSNNYMMHYVKLSPQPTISGDQQLPRVRGLTNLGNTCFFNAVMQCLAQTPYLLDVLKQLSEPGENFILPGGTFKFKDNENVELPMIKGTLSQWGGLTAALANTLEELQSGGGVFSPDKLFNKLCVKNPQFRGGDQHDSHELLRHLLESVRSEDLKRYQRVILHNLGYSNEDTNCVSEELRQKCKIYGGQASDRILRPDQVFRGFLVSTLTCQECFNVSSRHEYFLDLSLPVSVEKPQPPQRRKTSPENSAFGNSKIPTINSGLTVGGMTKAQQKGEKEKDRKARRMAKRQHKKLSQRAAIEDLSADPGGDGAYSIFLGCAKEEEDTTTALTLATSPSEQSDADVEDNLIDDVDAKARGQPTPTKLFDANGNDQETPAQLMAEKCGDSPENVDKDSIADDDENDSGIATSPANNGRVFPSSSTVSSGGDAVSTTTSLVAVGLSEKGATLVRQLTLGEDDVRATLENIVNFATQIDDSAQLTNGNATSDEPGILTKKLEELVLNDHQQTVSRIRAQRVRTQSHSDWSTTIAPRYHCKENECSVQSCLNNFTGVELMTGNNKVGCENCTRRLNNDDPKAKTVNTNATKQFLISSPPAVLILHLKRFQLGLRSNFRKLTLGVSFPLVLDIAPFCGSKVKNLPNIDRRQKKLLYALYGVVEHSGSMYGGHYTAFVKVRPKLAADDKRWSFIPEGSKAELDQDDEQRKKLDELLAKAKARELRLNAANDSDDFSNSSSSSGSASTSETEQPSNAPDTAGAAGGDEEAAHVQVPIGQWYYVSDTQVRLVNEEEVLKSQAYLLFYERIY